MGSGRDTRSALAWLARLWSLHPPHLHASKNPRLTYCSLPFPLAPHLSPQTLHRRRPPRRRRARHPRVAARGASDAAHALDDPYVAVHAQGRAGELRAQGAQARDKVRDADLEVVGRWIRFLDAHSEGGVGLRVVRWDCAPVGVGREALRRVDEWLMLKKGGASIKRLGEKIVEAEGGVPAKENAIKVSA
jgi:hypothetical protein